MGNWNGEAQQRDDVMPVAINRSPIPVPRSPVPAHIILVGLPGAGKSTVGRGLAARLGLPFLDFDRELERREGMRVSAIFAERGEPYFRSLERALTEELREGERKVLAPGGGWVTNPGVMALLRPPSRIVYLAVRPETALARLRNTDEIRPLLSVADPLAALRRLLAEREAVYRQADDVLDAELLNSHQLIDRLTELASAPREG